MSRPAARGTAAARAPVVALLERRGRFLTATPFFERGGQITLEARGPGGERCQPRAGDLVLVDMAPSGRRGRGGAGARVTRVLGRPDVARDVLEALMLQGGLRREFDPLVEREARAARDAGQAGTVGSGPSRRDLRDLATFTIDPVSARDFDDAISAETLPDGGVRVWVHIADVSAYVRPRSALDREAHRRATSVYVPGAVEPMLPEALSADACSLRPRAERLAVTVEMDLHGARVRRAAFYRSLIVSDERLDYDRVDRIFAGQEKARAPWGKPLAAARAAAAALHAARTHRGALVIESSEPDFDFDQSGHVVAVRSTPQTESHRLVEHLMIAANEQVARRLEESGTPALYRVHERPDPPRVQRLAEQLESLGVATPPLPDPMSPQQAADLVGEMSRLVAQHTRRTGHGQRALSSLVLRSLKQASYRERNLGHAGLHSPRYCHFTSPIRRYPDLVCHRALLAGLDGSEAPPRREGMEELALWTSAREREAMTVERDADDVARCYLLERELLALGWRHVFDGEVVGLIAAGAFVAFGEGYEGMLPVRRLEGDWWELNEQGTILAGAHTGATLRLGDPVGVAVDRVQAPRGRVDLVLGDASGYGDGQGPQTQGRRR